MISRTKANDRRGFSLLELLVVLSLMAICMGIFVPSTSTWFQRIELQRAVSAWEQALRYSRVRALETGIKHGIYYDSQSYVLFAQPIGSTGGPLETNRIDGRFPCPVNTRFNLLATQSTNGKPFLAVYPSGHADEVIIEMKLGSSAQRIYTHRFTSNLITESDKD